MLHSLGVLVYSPPLHYAIQATKEIDSGHSWEVQLRGCSIWYVHCSAGSQCLVEGLRCEGLSNSFVVRSSNSILKPQASTPSSSTSSYMTWPKSEKLQVRLFFPSHPRQTARCVRFGDCEPCFRSVHQVQSTAKRLIFRDGAVILIVKPHAAKHAKMHERAQPHHRTRSTAY